MQIAEHRVYDGPSPADGPAYARHADLAEFAIAHECECLARRELVGSGVEALATTQPHKQTQRYRKYAQNLRGALKRIRVAATTAIGDRDFFGLEGPPEMEALVDDPPAFDYPRDAQKAAAFRAWLDDQLDAEVLEQFGGENQYISSGYERGIRDADADLRQAGLANPDEPVSAVVRTGVHEDAMSALFERNYRALEGMTDELGRDLSRELLDGFSQGEGPYDVARRIRDTVGSAGETHTGYMARSDTIARSEIMRAQHVSSMRRYEQFGVERVTILLSPTACDACQALKADAPYDRDDAEGLLPQHPNCRCSVTIYTGS